MADDKYINVETYIETTATTISINTKYVSIEPVWVLDTGIWGDSSTTWTATGVWNTI